MPREIIDAAEVRAMMAKQPRKGRKRARNPESVIVKACLELLAARGVMAWRSNNMPAFDKASGRMRKFNGRRGVSDILAVYNGQLLAIEVKTPAGKLSEEQRQFLADVDLAGGGICVVRSVADLDAWLREVSKKSNY